MRLKRFALCTSVLALLLLSGCKKDEEGTFHVTFTGSFGNEPLVMFDVHDYINGQRVQFSRSEFFISDLNLIDGSGNTYPLSDIELIDLSFTNAASAGTGVVLTFDKVPAGTYADLEFGFGVASDINATQPADYPSSSPLSSTGRYWTPWTSFIFSKTEGNLDTLVDGTDDPDLGFAYHTGTDDLYQELRINTAISIPDGGTAGIIFNLDHEKLMGIPDDPIDIKANPQNHNPQDLLQVQAIINNVISALTFILE
ncbi:MAG TPA: MbnP family protein [Saprospiraceae bacterium]|nr:MbnP family protein [Saprospiraceae bacterium]